MERLRKRKIQNNIAIGFSLLASIIGLFWLVFILFDVLRHGLSFFDLNLFIEDPAPPGFEGGGMRNAFIGQFMITGCAIVIGIPFGILGGTFLSEYGRMTKIGRLISVISDIMISVPTIVVGTFIYSLMVKPLGHFSGWAGSVSLAMIMIPVTLRTTEDMMSLVPWSIREAAFALGAPYYKVIIQVVYRGAIAGILTGILLSIARIAGETAPLLFTSFNNSFISLNMEEPMASLTVTIFQYATGPYDDWHAMAWAASFVIILAILLLTVLGRLLVIFKYSSK
ncbi:MAG: phosphate ABC transporter permease PstA [Deltaproteobacteria bacterium]|nr:phosphate ABC transporter permease PstA [Deltaproteobacteria bacterium]